MHQHHARARVAVLVATAALTLAACSDGSSPSAVAPTTPVPTVTAPPTVTPLTTPVAETPSRPVMTVTPRTELLGGQVVTVELTGLRPNEKTLIAICPAPRGSDVSEACALRLNGGRVTTRSDAAGRASARMTVTAWSGQQSKRGATFACPPCFVKAWQGVDEPTVATAALKLRKPPEFAPLPVLPAAGPLPQGIVPATAKRLVGVWEPAKRPTGGAELTITPDGVYSATDGCNGGGGEWAAGRGGSLKVSGGGTTAKFCGGFHPSVPTWFYDAKAAGFDGTTLVLFGKDGSVHRLARVN